MQQHELFEFLLDTFAELATLHAAAAVAAEQAWSVLAKQDEAYPQGVSCGDRHRGCLPHDRLRVDPMTFTVEWQGQRCDLGPSILFKLIQRLASRPGRYFTYDILMEDVWEQRCSNTTIRSAVKGIIQERNRRWSDEELIRMLVQLVKKHSDVSAHLIDQADGMPSSATYRSRFGNKWLPDITIMVRMNPANDEPSDFYLLPLLDIRSPSLRLAEHNAAYVDAYRFDSLDGFAQLALRKRIETRS